MSSESYKRKLKVIPLNEEETAHEELEKACNDVNGSTKRVFDWTVFLIGKIYDRYLKEGKDSEDDLRKICREIWKRHPEHKRQIQRVFDWKDPNTEERPYRRFKGKYGEEDETELRITTKSPKSILLDKLQGEQKATYDTFQSETAEHFSENIKEMQELILEEGLSNDDLKKLLYTIQDTGSTVEKELNSRGIKGFIPTNVGISYGGRKSDDDSTFTGIDDAPRKPIHLKAASVPKSEQLRMLQEMEGKLMYAASRGYKSMGDSLIKMNYISDDPKVNEKLIVIQLQEMMTFAFATLQIFNEFMEYFEKFKSKEKMTEEDREIIRALLHTISHLAIKVKGFG